MLSVDNIVQENSGSTSATSTNHVVSLLAGTTAGNTLILYITSASTTDMVAPAGSAWVLDLDANGGQVFRLSDTTAGVTSWTFTTSVATVRAWHIAEVEGLDLIDPLDAAIHSVTAPVNGGTTSTLTTPTTVGTDTMAFAWFQARTTDVGTVASWSGYTNGFTERAQIAGNHPTQNVAAAVAFSSSTRTWECTATLATTDADGHGGYGTIVSYREAGSAMVNPLTMLTGFEFGMNGGTSASTVGQQAPFGAGTAPTGTWNTNWLIQTASARAPSTYGLRVVQSAVAAYVRVGTIGASVNSATVGFNVRVVSGTSIPVVAEIISTTSVRVVQLVYNISTTKFGVRCGTTGTIQYQPGTTALNTWVWVDLRIRANSTTWTADWRIETAANTYTAQTTATLAGQSVAGGLATLCLGSATSQTITADFDDVLVSRYASVFPLGPHVIRAMKVDPADTPTVAGVTTDFQVMTANGTLAAWNATNARNAVDELPPTISAAADALVQTVINASNYVELPMETYTLTSSEVINGVRMLAAMWATVAGGTVTFEVRGWDGSTEVGIVGIGTAFNPGQPTAQSATAPAWRCGMWQNVNGWTQAELNAAALRFGYSTNDAPGLQAIYLEVAVGRTRTRTLFGTLASVEEDPLRQGIASATVTAPVGYPTDLVYETGGSPTTVPVAGGATTTAQINAGLAPDTNYIAAYPAAEPPPVD